MITLAVFVTELERCVFRIDGYQNAPYRLTLVSRKEILSALIFV